MNRKPFWPVATLILLAALPAQARGQVEIGFDAGLSILSIDDVDDNVSEFSLISETLRLGFPIDDRLIFEPVVAFQRESFGDFSFSTLLLLPGLVVQLGDVDADAPTFYLRGEGGLIREAESDGDDDDSETQFGVGGAAGLRSPLGESGLFRVEGGFDVFFEKKDNDVVTARGFKLFRVLVGVSLIVD